LVYGAKCDGTTNDSAAVQAAANAALAAGGGNIAGVEGKTCVAGNVEIGAGVEAALTELAQAERALA